MKRKTDKNYQESRSKLGSSTWDEVRTHIGVDSNPPENVDYEGDGANDKIDNEGNSN